jgi:hypothetical protein
MSMYNWSTDTARLSKFPEEYAIWKMEQLINFGLNGQKLNQKELKKHFNELQIDPQKKKYLSFLLS